MNSLSCSLPFAFTPQPADYSSPYDYRAQGQRCIDLPALLERTNELNVPFSNKAYLDAQMCCNLAAPMLPKWPTQGSTRLYPVIDRTVDSYPVRETYWEDGVNAYRDILTDQVSQDGSWIPGPAQIIAREKARSCKRALAENVFYDIDSPPPVDQEEITDIYARAKSRINVEPKEETVDQEDDVQETVQEKDQKVEGKEGRENRKDQSIFKNMQCALKGAAHDLTHTSDLPEKNKLLFVCTRNDRICYFIFLLLLIILSVLVLVFIVKFFIYICR